MTLSPIREFALKALLWLPLSFVLWFWFASPLVWPVIHLAGRLLDGLWPDLFGAVVQNGFLMEATSHVLVVQADAAGRQGVGELVLTVNPQIYGYGLPLFAGLAMATPLGSGRRGLQMALALVLVWLAQTFGVVCESLKLLAFDSGAPGVAAIARHALPANAIALAYQFGYLILPAVLPVALWIGLNRDFIAALTRPAEPKSATPGQN